MSRIQTLEDVQKHAYAIVEGCVDVNSFLYAHLLGNRKMEELLKEFKIEGAYERENIGHYLTVGDVVKGEKVVDGQYPVVVRFTYVWIRSRLFVWWEVSGTYADYQLCYKVLPEFFSSVPRQRHVQGNLNLISIINQLPRS